MTNYTKLSNYDLQSDYVDKLTDAEKLQLFRRLSDEVQSIADEAWNSDDNYSEEFMIKWITESYADAVTCPFYNCDMFDYDDSQWWEFCNEHWIEKFSDYSPYDVDHVVLFILKGDVDWESVEDDGSADIYRINKDESTVEFMCPSFVLDVPREFLVQFIMENVGCFNYSNIEDVILG